MDMKVQNGLLILTAFTVGACQPRAQEATSTAPVDTTAILASVDSLRLAYEQAVAERDWQKLETLLTEGAVTVSAGGAAHDSLRAASEAPFPEGATLKISSVEVGVLSADWAYDLGNGVLTWTPEGADQPRTVSDTYLVLLHRTDDGWKVHREVASSRPLPRREN